MKRFRRKKLPILVTAWTACFRSEAGAAERTRAAFSASTNSRKSSSQVHASEKSYEEHEALTRNAEVHSPETWLHYRTMLLFHRRYGCFRENLRP